MELVFNLWTYFVIKFLQSFTFFIHKKNIKKLVLCDISTNLRLFFINVRAVVGVVVDERYVVERHGKGLSMLISSVPEFNLIFTTSKKLVVYFIISNQFDCLRWILSRNRQVPAMSDLKTRIILFFLLAVQFLRSLRCPGQTRRRRLRIFSTKVLFKRCLTLLMRKIH